MSLFTLFKDWMRLSATPQRAAGQIVSGGLIPGNDPFSVAGIVAEAPRKEKGGTLGMQGYAPIVKQTYHRHGTRCRCGDVVLRGVRHICIYNAEHHLTSLTADECARLIDQLKRLSNKRGVNSELLIQRAGGDQGRRDPKGDRGAGQGSRAAASPRGRSGAGAGRSVRHDRRAGGR